MLVREYRRRTTLRTEAATAIPDDGNEDSPPMGNPASSRMSFAIYCCSSSVTSDRILRSKEGGARATLR